MNEFLEATTPSREAILQRMESAIAGALPSPEAVIGRLDVALQDIPSKSDLMARIAQALDFMPSREHVLAAVEGHVAPLMPTGDEVQITLRSTLDAKIEGALEEAGLKQAIPQMLPTTEQVLDAFYESLPDKERFQDALVRSITVAIESSLPEKVWMESVSRGLFDERTRGLIPRREEVVAMLREEIQTKLLDSVEKIVREQIQKIAADLES